MSDELYRIKDRDYFGGVRWNVFNVVEDKDFGHVLDIGGGDGASARYVVDNDFAQSVYVLDPYAEIGSTEQVKVSNESADDLTVFDRLNREGMTFDTVFCFDVLEHLFNPWAVLKTVCDHQSTGGRLVVSMPNARFVALTVPLVLFGRFDYKKSGIMDRTHIRWFTRATTIELIEGAGYTIDKIDAVFEARVKILNLLTLGLFRRFFEYQYVVQATKK